MLLMFVVGISFVILTTNSEAANTTCDPCRCCVGACNVTNNFTCDHLGCVDGYWEKTCQQQCPDTKCKVCERSKGRCKTCIEGHLFRSKRSNFNCNQLCSTGCKSCSGRAYNCKECLTGFSRSKTLPGCSRRCPSTCSNCSDSGDACYSCQDGYFSTSKLCSERCGSGCETCDSPYLCITCKHGFYGPKCTYRCPENCTKCSDPLTCTECRDSHYGLTCEHKCSHGCTSLKCDRLDGFCPSCWKGFTGPKCNMCEAGVYGLNCSKTCPPFCKGHLCHPNTGGCTFGCIQPSIQGPFCDRCVNGRYGNMCLYLCPLNCLSSVCDRQSGNCVLGCKANYTGARCTTCSNNTILNTSCVLTPDAGKDTTQSMTVHSQYPIASNTSESSLDHGSSISAKRTHDNGTQPYETLTYVFGACVLVLTLTVFALLLILRTQHNRPKVNVSNYSSKAPEIQEQPLDLQEGPTTSFELQEESALYSNAGPGPTYEMLDRTNQSRMQTYDVISPQLKT